MLIDLTQPGPVSLFDRLGENQENEYRLRFPGGNIIVVTYDQARSIINLLTVAIEAKKKGVQIKGRLVSEDLDLVKNIEGA